jgi:nitroimidazol reductase NimA-like FMN-containing flavoprotein (pyridoxamine 5'-phosphate oxidase superfamily)
MTTGWPRFRDLERDEIEQMLREHRYGRLAFAFRDRVDIEPISCVYEDGWIYGRTAPGTKLSVLERHPWVAFEIDEVQGPFDWRSVVVKGTIYFVEPDGGQVLDEAWARTLSAIRRLMPAALTGADPVPQRSVLFRLHVDEMHGRAATSSGSPQRDA